MHAPHKRKSGEPNDDCRAYLGDRVACIDPAGRSGPARAREQERSKQLRPTARCRQHKAGRDGGGHDADCGRRWQAGLARSASGPSGIDGSALWSTTRLPASATATLRLIQQRTAIDRRSDRTA